jgi:Flp pilus assembly protein TadB
VALVPLEKGGELEVSDQEVRKKRSAKEIRESLESRQEQLDRDLDALGERVQRTMDVRRHVMRHPLIFALAGAVVGFVVVRKPSILFKAVRRLASIGAPVLVSALLRSPSPTELAESDAPPSSPPEQG